MHRQPNKNASGLAGALFLALAAAGCSRSEALDQRPPGASDEVWGRALFFHHRCATCHDVRGQQRTGPPLNSRFGASVVLDNNTTVQFDSAYFKVAVWAPEQHRAKGYSQPMPSYRDTVTREQLAALEAYLRSL